MSDLLQCQRWQVKSTSKEVCVFKYQEEYERLQVRDPENKKIILSKYATFNDFIVEVYHLSAGREVED